MPFTAFISADGVVVKGHNGALTEGQLEDLIRELFPAILVGTARRS